MRLIKIVILAIIAVGLVFLAVANRQVVTLRLAPEGVPLPFPASIDLPLYAVIIAAVALGALIGALLELIREHGHRRAENRHRREAQALRREVRRLTDKADETDDEILGVTH